MSKIAAPRCSRRETLSAVLRVHELIELNEFNVTRSEKQCKGTKKNAPLQIYVPFRGEDVTFHSLLPLPMGAGGCPPPVAETVFHKIIAHIFIHPAAQLPS